MVRSCIHFWHGAKEEAIVYNYLVLCQIFSRLYGRDLNHTEEGGEKRIWGGGITTKYRMEPVRDI
jgi:hypothetical protein